MADKKKIEAENTSLIGKIGALFSKFMHWLAKGQEGNLPCSG